jgi:hypothetical protein
MRDLGQGCARVRGRLLQQVVLHEWTLSGCRADSRAAIVSKHVAEWCACGGACGGSAASPRRACEVCVPHRRGVIPVLSLLVAVLLASRRCVVVDVGRSAPSRGSCTTTCSSWHCAATTRLRRSPVCILWTTRWMRRTAGCWQPGKPSKL